jgi:hypothetical protein
VKPSDTLHSSHRRVANKDVIQWIAATSLTPKAHLRLARQFSTLPMMHLYEVYPRKDKRGVDLISDVLPFGRLWYGEQNAVSNAIGYATQYSRSHHAVIRVYDDAGNVIKTHEHKGEFKDW